jgi:hypothetical protein
MKKKKPKLTILQKKNHNGEEMPTIFSLKNRKGSAITDILPWLIIAVVILVLSMITIFILSGKGIEFIDKIKNLFKGR